MPMNPRLLRPLASRSLVDADATAYLTAVSTADTQALEPAVRNAITAFVIGLKQDGIWSAIRGSCILMGARTLAGALTPLKGGSPTNVSNNFVSGDYNRETGLIGNGTNKLLNTNQKDDADPQNSRHGAIYITTAATVGVYSQSAGLQLALTTSFINAGVAASHSAPAAVSLFGVSRGSSANYVRRLNGTNTTVSVASVAAANTDTVFFGRNNNTNFSDGRLAFYSVGSDLDLSLLEARVSALYTAIGAAI